MPKYHINSKSEPGLCKAKPGNCPFGDESEHFESLSDVKRALEQKLSSEHTEEKISKSERAQTTLLSDLVSADAFRSAIAEGLISERAHPDDPNLRIYSYTPKTQYSGMWTPETLLARGLILEVPQGDLDNAKIVSRGLPKFFTVEQMDNDWSRVKLVDDDEGVIVSEAPEISWDAPASVSEKMNGALGLAYLAPNGSVGISTKGSFGSLEAEVGTKLMENLSSEQQKEFVRMAMNGKTPLFEIITPKRPHPVSYGDREELVLLGSVNNATGEWSPVEKDSEIARKFGFSSAEQLSYKNLKEAVEAPYRTNTEGFVVTVAGKNGQEIYKVKPPEYHRLRSFFYSSTPKELASHFSTFSGKQLSEIRKEDQIEFDSALTAGLAPDSVLVAERKKLAFDGIIAPTNELAKKAQSRVSEIVANQPDGFTEKDILIQISKEPQETRSLIFKAYKDLSTGKHSVFEAARDVVLKNLKKQTS